MDITVTIPDSQWQDFKNVAKDAVETSWNSKYEDFAVSAKGPSHQGGLVGLPDKLLLLHYTESKTRVLIEYLMYFVYKSWSGREFCPDDQALEWQEDR